MGSIKINYFVISKIMVWFNSVEIEVLREKKIELIFNDDTKCKWVFEWQKKWYQVTNCVDFSTRQKDWEFRKNHLNHAQTIYSIDLMSQLMEIFKYFYSKNGHSVGPSIIIQKVRSKSRLKTIWSI